MAIKYIDFKNGNDANDGLSFANRVKSFSGLGMSSIESSANTSVDVQGDEIRVMGMEPVDLGVDATWTKGGYANYGADGSVHLYDSSDGATAGTPITITANNHQFVTGDVVLIYGIKGIIEANGCWIITKTGTNTFTLNNSTGTGTYGGRQHSNNLRRVNNKVIKVNTDCKRVAFCSGSVPAVGNSTYDLSNNLFGVLSTNVSIDQQRWNMIQRTGRVDISGNFTTGKAMYFTLPAPVDLSDYQKISFNFFNYENTNTRVMTSHLSVKLCTDTTGDVVAHSCDIGGHDESGNYPHVFDFGTNLNSSIKSIAIYSDTDVGSTHCHVDNIIALKNTTATVSHRDVWGKNTTAEPIWWRAQYIQEDLMTFGMCDHNAHGDKLMTNGDVASYAGTSETVRLYKITPFDVIQDGQDYDEQGFEYKYFCRPSFDGRQSSAITKIRGGWNESDMTTQNCVTWMNWYRRGATIISRGFNGNTANVEFENFGKTGGNRTCYMNFQMHQAVKNVYHAGLGQDEIVGVANHDNKPVIVDGVFSTANGRFGFYLADQRFSSDADTPRVIIKNVHFYGVGDNTMQYFPYGGTVVIEDITIKSSRWMMRSGGNVLSKVLIKNFVGSGFQYYMSNGAEYQIHNSTIDNVLFEVYPHTINEKGSTYNGRLCFRNYNGVANDHRIYTDGGCIKSETSVRHGTDGIAWKIQPKRLHTGSNAANIKGNTDAAPFYFKVLSLFVNASKLVTVKAYLRRDNTGITARIAARQMYSPFTVSTDQVATMTAAADTWQEVTLSFTPIDSGELSIMFEAFGGNSHTAYIDSVSVTQAP